MTAFTHAHFYKWTWYSAVFDRSVYFCAFRRLEICLDCQTPVPSGRIKYCPKKEGKNAPGLPGVHQDMGVTAIMDQKTFDEEQKHLTLVYGKLTETCADLTKRMEELNATAEADKKDILSNLRLDTADDEVRYETYGEIETWNRYIDDYNVRADAMGARLKSVKALLESPYFARVTIQFDEDEEPEDYYIGRAAFSENGYDQVVLDWRSPLAETYYNQDNGKTYYTVDGKKIPCDLLLRRQFDLDRDHLNGYFDTQIAIEDPLLLASLSRTRTDKMQSITATIQKEQNAIIRYPDVPVMLVNGIAGSGKTSVLLQRIAYLFYHQRKTLRPENVYLMTLNPVFRQYIDNVLPDLGEENPGTMTWKEFLQYVHNPIPDPGLTTDPASLEKIDRELSDFVLEKEDLISIRQKGKTVLHTDEILQVLRRHPNLKTGVRLIQVAEDELEDEIRAVLKKRREQQDKTENDLSYDTAEDAKGENQIENDFGGAFSMARSFGWLNIQHIAQRFLKKRHITSIEWFYLKMALTGECDRNASYVMIDEVQDYTKPQLMTLAKYFVNAKFMLLGDEFQSIRDNNVTFQEIHALFAGAGKQVTELPLQTSYRSSPEITDLFAGLLPKEKQLEANSVQRPGVAPKIRSFAEHADYVAALKEEIEEAGKKDGLTAVICRDRRSFQSITDLLGKDYLPAVSKEEPLPKKGAFLIELVNAKGLEFDHVILPDANAKYYPEDLLSRHCLYTAISRATTSLTLLAEGGITPLLSGKETC